jgi:hypothetical protein
MHTFTNNKETVYKRVNSSKEHMGLTNFKGEIPSKKEAETAKNYLTKDAKAVVLTEEKKKNE